MDNDDLPIGRILSRREVVALVGAGGAALLAACAAPPAPTATPPPAPTTTPPPAASLTATPMSTTGTANTPAISTRPATAAATRANPTAIATQAGAASMAVPACVVRPQVTEGPYYVDVDLVRADIRSDPGSGVVKDGAPLVLTFHVLQVAAGGCTPLPGAEVEIWHCDAAGVYSGVADPNFSTVGQKWLRGSLMTNADGMATFTTIYPGWYRGRAIHIHFKVRPTATTDFTSQLFFDDALSDQVFTQAPYASKGRRDRLNSNDGIFNQQLLLTTTQAAQGYAATFPIGIDLSKLGVRKPGP